MSLLDLRHVFLRFVFSSASFKAATRRDLKLVSSGFAVVALGSALAPLSTVRAEVIHGVVALHPTYVMGWPDPMVWHDGFDFETQTVVVYTTAPSDLSWAETTPDAEAIFFPHNAAGIQLVDTPLAQLDAAPAIAANYYAVRAVSPSAVYVMRTGSGHYVKFAQHFPDEGDVTIEYYIQMDGSQNFNPALAVEPTTWGKVKALYR